uniref:hypothetical protein n=1 Tax=Novosphingobium aquimarinum TaxID=2682494 RepID=UPI0012EB9756
MSDGNWGYRLAALAALVALTFVSLGTGAYFGSLYAPAHKQYGAVIPDESATPIYQGVTKSLPNIALVPDPVERAIANPPPDSGEDHEQRDLAAQESMAAWAFYMTVFAGLTALVTFLGTILIWKQVSLTREAVKETGDATKAMIEANRITQRTARAFVILEKIWVQFETKDIEGPTFSVAFHNAGQTPAEEYRHIHRCFVDVPGIRPEPIALEELCVLPPNVLGPRFSSNIRRRRFDAPPNAYADFKAGKLSVYVVSGILYKTYDNAIYKRDVIYRSKDDIWDNTDKDDYGVYHAFTAISQTENCIRPPDDNCHRG